MARRAKIGIPFNYDESWIAGGYYIQNLVASFRLLDTADQPEVCILAHTKQSFDFIRDGSQYERLTWLPPVRLSDVDGGIFPKIRRIGRLVPSFLKRKPIFDVIFPFPIDTTLQQTVCWIPDFQEKHLPHFFSKEELAYRQQQHEYYIDKFHHILFSSEAARTDFHTFYPDAKNRTHVVHFAVFPPPRPALLASDILKKYGLPKRFFYCPNQFWVHKNHITVIEAIAQLAENGVRVSVAFSGKEHDHRSPQHAESLRQMARDRGVADLIHFLGFLPRDEQMVLFDTAIAIVQPSLFEGWSTVIEDAKTVSQYVIASALPANMEQISVNAEFFDPTKPQELASKLRHYVDQDPRRIPVDYSEAQCRFARDFMRVVRAVQGSETVRSNSGTSS